MSVSAGRHRIAEDLGNPHSALARHAALAVATPTRNLLDLVGRLPAPLGDKLSVIGIGEATLKRYRRTPSAPLPAALAERTLELDHLLNRAVSVMGSDAAAQAWLTSEQRALDFARPLDLLTTGPGRLAVEDLLGRIEYGVHT